MSILLENRNGIWERKRKKRDERCYMKKNLRNPDYCGEKVWINAPHNENTQSESPWGSATGSARNRNPRLYSRRLSRGLWVRREDSVWELALSPAVALGESLSFFPRFRFVLSCVLGYVQRVWKILGIFNSESSNIKEIDLNFRWEVLRNCDLKSSKIAESK